METIIVLKGDQKTGKSTTIRNVYRLLLDGSLFRQRVNVKVEGKLGSKATNAVVTINGVKIGIESFGDYPKRLRDILRRFKDAGCYVIICAARPSFADDIVNEVPNHDPEWINKRGAGSSPHAQERANEKTAKQIVARIRKLLREKRGK